MKARIIGTPYEVEVIPYFPEGMFAGFTDVSGTLQPGMVVYKSSDLEFLETPPKLKPEVDWDAFRREAAKDILTGIATNISLYVREKNRCAAAVKDALALADELIKQLRDGKE